MVQRIASQRKNTWKFALFLLIAAVVLSLLLAKHYEISQQDARQFLADAQSLLIIKAAQANLHDPCTEDTSMIIFSPTVYVCDEPRDDLVYDEIYNLYPASARGREVIYSFIETGNKTRADEMLENVYNIQRFPAATLTDPLTWQEDPFGERYWRFIFYSLRPVRHLLATAQETRAERYYDKAIEIIESFVEEGMDEEHAWDDAHGVAFRTMVLVNAWWKLREAGELSSDLSDKILLALEEHGNFLMDPENYEADYNHAITQSAALLLLSDTFPDLANAGSWRDTAIRRISIGLSSIVDPNGVLNENSPFYHFYVLEKYWEIKRYADENSISISDDFNETIDQMVGFATYVLRPDLSVPLLGASIPRTLVRSGEYASMAEEDDEFDFVLTKGESGDVPRNQHVLYPSSGLAIFRSGWGQNRPYEDETQLIFDAGPYRTDHSDLDTLNFTLFSFGTPIVRDTGLFTYETEHELFDYFHGTRGHNTVMVDDGDQAEGLAAHQSLVRGEGYAWVTGKHQLYNGVTHHRAIMLIGHDAVLIADSLGSNSSHTYEQLFHFSPDASIKQETPELVTGTVEGPRTEVAFSITQLIRPNSVASWVGEKNPIRGLCANGYEVVEPCPEVAFENQATNTRYVTLLQISENEEGDSFYESQYQEESAQLLLHRGNERFVIDIDFPDEGLFSSDFIKFSVENLTEESSFFDGARSFFRRLGG